MFCPNAKNLLKCLLVLMMTGCGPTKDNEGLLSGSSGSVQVQPIEEKLNQMNLKKGRAQLVFKTTLKKDDKLTAFSVEQPEVRLTNLQADSYGLLNLFPQKHTLVAQVQSSAEIAFAVVSNVDLAANEFADLGLLAFEKPGSLTGRVLNATDSSPIADVLVQIPQLNLKTQTDANGNYVFESLPPGRWTLDLVKQELGRLSDVSVKVVSGSANEAGDHWLGPNEGSNSVSIANAENGYIMEKRAILRLKLAPSARSVSVRDPQGHILFEHSPVRELVPVVLEKQGVNELHVVVYDSKQRVMGVLATTVNFDPFYSNGKPYLPNARVETRVINSPSRRIQVALDQIPSQAKHVRLGTDDHFGEWTLPSAVMNVDIPKSNKSCGQRELTIQYQTSSLDLSAITRIPVTLSCWQRIPHRAMLNKLVGLENAAIWTGTHAFVWSGKQLSPTSRTVMDMGSTNSENSTNLSSLQSYDYLDGGYIMRPTWNAETNSIGRPTFESIVTDNAPQARAQAGVAGSGNLVAIYGGENNEKVIADGGVYDIERNGWISMTGDGSPSPRLKPSVFFISPRKVLVWGGRSKTNLGYEVPLNDGAIYDIDRHTWTPISNDNAPSARSKHVGVWTGSEFVVLGGQLPGAVEVMTGARYKPAINTWTATANLNTPVTFMTPLHKGDEIILYGRDNKSVFFSLKDNRETLSLKLSGLSGWNVDPTVVMDGDGTGPEGSQLFVFGGRASFNSTDAAGSLLRLTYKPGQLYSPLEYKDIFNGTGLMPAYQGKYLENCCVDMLGFEFNNRIFAMNGTSITNYSIYADVDVNSNVYGGKFNSTESVPAYKGSHSFYFYANDAFTITREPIDVAPEYDSAGKGPVGPYSMYWTHPPAWNAANRSLIWYSGRYRGLINDLYQSGGWIYHVDQKQWNTIPHPATETYINNGITRNSARFNYWSFFLSNTFYVLGGVRLNGSALQPAYDGLAIPFESGIALKAQQILNGANDEFDFPIRDHSTYANLRWASNPECIIGNNVFLSGGRRMSIRTIGGQSKDSALVEHKIVFNAQNAQMRIVNSDPLGLRTGSAVVSTGESCFIWGGYTADGAKFKPTEAESATELTSRFVAQNSGFLFNPTNDEWKPLPTAGAPSARAFVHSVWTGTDVLLWGGAADPSPSINKDIEKNKGVYLFRPSENSWRSLPSAAYEPMFNGDERPVWMGSRMFIWKTSDVDYSFEFDPLKNEWTRHSVPYGFGFRYNQFWDSNVVWMGDRLFVMPYLDRVLGVMAIYVPPNP